MANPHKGEIEFEAEGQSYVLQFSIDAICQLEAQTGKGIVALLGELQDPEKMSLTIARQVLWAGLQEHHPEISVKDAGELIPAAGGLARLITLFGEAFSIAFPPLDGDNPHPRKAGDRKNGIGPRYSRTGAASAETKKPSGERHHAKST